VPLHRSADEHSGQVHALLKPADEGSPAGVLRDVPDGRAADRGSQEPGRSSPRVPAVAPDSDSQAADGDWREGVLQRSRRIGEVAMPGVQGFMYPNEDELQWSILIVLYPYITALATGAFILASLERVFNVQAVRLTYRLALLTALAFLLFAPLPLQLHLGHPERSFEMYLTPHRTSAMAMFGFVYLWYLMAVLLVEIWLDYRKELVLAARSSAGITRIFYRALTLGSDNISPESLRIDDRVGRTVTIIGIPSAFMLHGYVGFIFGSVKANPWWSTPMMPIVFLFSAIVSGIAMVMVL